jgi:hypothetical protein
MHGTVEPAYRRALWPKHLNHTTSMRGTTRTVCKAFPPGCPDPTDLWLDLLDLLSCDAATAVWVHQVLHVDSFEPADVCRFCMPWLLDPFCLLSACPRSVCAAVCSVLACYVLWLGLLLLMQPCLLVKTCLLLAWCAVACALSHCCSRPVLPAVARPSFRLLGDAEAEALLGRARGYRQKDADTGTCTVKWKNAGTVPFVPGV